MFKPGDKVKHADGDIGVVVSPEQYAKLNYQSLEEVLAKHGGTNHVLAIWGKTQHPAWSEFRLCSLVKSFKQRNLPTWW